MRLSNSYFTSDFTTHKGSRSSYDECTTIKYPSTDQIAIYLHANKDGHLYTGHVLVSTDDLPLWMGRHPLLDDKISSILGGTD